MAQILLLVLPWRQARVLRMCYEFHLIVLCLNILNLEMWKDKMYGSQQSLKRAMYNPNSFQLWRNCAEMTRVDLHLTYTSELLKTLRLQSEMGRHSYWGQQISVVECVNNPNAVLSFIFIFFIFLKPFCTTEVAFRCIYRDCLMQLRGGMNASTLQLRLHK